MHLNESIFNIYARSSYDFGTRGEELVLKDDSLASRLARLEYEYGLVGIRRSVQAVLVVHEHNLPHVLLFQRGTSLFMAPWSDLNVDESEFDGLKKCLVKFLGIESHTVDEFEVADLLAKWWRPHFEPPLYPYVPPHVTAPKEMVSQFIIKLPPQATFAVPKNLNLLAVPIMEFYTNAKQYGPVLASLPTVLNRFEFNFL